LGVDLLALSGHKFHAPKGVGMLYLKQGTPYLNTITGGGQEGNQRAGTQNVPAIVGFAKALELAHTNRATKNARLERLRDLLIHAVLEAVPTATLTGHPSQRLPGHASFTMGAGVEAGSLLFRLDHEGIAASSGSACSSGESKPSHVLTAMGIPADIARSALRLTLGDDNTLEDVHHAAEIVPKVVNRLLVPRLLQEA
jgi:cysteine desulfurase